MISYNRPTTRRPPATCSASGRVVKQLAPKAPRKRLQLHRDGCIISTEEELQWILDDYGARYGANASDTPPLVGNRLDKKASIDPNDLTHMLLRLHTRKAVPRECAPTILLRACSLQIADAVTAHVNHQWAKPVPEVEQGWSDAEVALLPKAHGRSQSPLDYRPIGLQDPLGKGIMTLLVRQARREIIALISKFPQTAYIPGRSTSTALRQVFSHCYRIRELSKNERLTLHQRAAGLQQEQCVGGLQISLDLECGLLTQ